MRKGTISSVEVYAKWFIEEVQLIDSILESGKDLAPEIEYSVVGDNRTLEDTLNNWKLYKRYQFIKEHTEKISENIYKVADHNKKEVIYDSITGEFLDGTGNKLRYNESGRGGYRQIYFRTSPDETSIHMRLHVLAGLLVHGDEFEKLAKAGLVGKQVQCSHMDENPNNNKGNNLEWVMYSDNSFHKALTNYAASLWFGKVDSFGEDKMYDIGGEEEQHLVWRFSISTRLIEGFYQHHARKLDEETLYKFMVYEEAYRQPDQSNRRFTREMTGIISSQDTTYSPIIVLD